MPATVKSLEERLDDLTEEFAAVKAQLGVFTGSLGTIQAQLASIVSNLGSTQAQLAIVVARLDTSTEEWKATRTKLDAMASDYGAFRAKAETTFSLGRWIGVFMAGALATVIISAFSVARSAGSLESTVQHQERTLNEIRRELSELHGKQKQ